MRYECSVASGYGMASKNSHEWFNAWANSIGTSLYPGTLNIIPNTKATFSKEGVSLKPWDGLLKNKSIKMATWYNPMLFPAKLNGCCVWVFYWGRDNKEGWLEIIAEECLRNKFSLNDGDKVVLECDFW